jgi:hypothetical protein
MSEELSERKINGDDLIQFTFEEIISNMKDIIRGNIAVFRKKPDGSLVTIPVGKLEQYFREDSNDTVDFFIEKNWKEKVREKNGFNLNSEVFKNSETSGSGIKKRSFELLEQYGKVTEQMKKFQLLSIVEREERLDVSIEKLHNLNEKKGLLDFEVVIQLVEVVANTYYANYANLEDILASENIKNNLYGIFIKTEWALTLIIEIFKNNGNHYENYCKLNEIDTGSYTIDNMCKGVLQFIGYCLFYNDYIDKGNVTKKLRGDYKERYLRYYKKRLDVDMMTLEKIIKGGLRKIEPEKEMVIYSMGALLYDIGKLPIITYHDSTDPYDESVVKMHVLIGYNMILKMKKYPFPVLAMAAFHHEYYGEKSGYNFTNPVLSKLTQKKRTEDNASCFITYDEKEFRDGTALAYFPCKMIEIIDVYNALVNRRNQSPFEALRIMKKNFITLSFKIDPLLYDIFLDFIQACGLINEKEHKEIDAIIY